MGDMTAEPSMEDILSSIKRIIAEEGDAAPARANRQVRPTTPTGKPSDDDKADEVLELNDPMPLPSAKPTTAAQSRAKPSPPASEPMVSEQTVAATRGSLETLSRLMVKPEAPGDGTLEGLVREMLRPMLREWLDANLPPLVEAMVAQEIAKITGRPD